MVHKKIPGSAPTGPSYDSTQTADTTQRIIKWSSVRDTANNSSKCPATVRAVTLEDMPGSYPSSVNDPTTTRAKRSCATFEYLLWYHTLTRRLKGTLWRTFDLDCCLNPRLRSIGQGWTTPLQIDKPYNSDITYLYVHIYPWQPPFVPEDVVRNTIFTE